MKNVLFQRMPVIQYGHQLSRALNNRSIFLELASSLQVHVTSIFATLPSLDLHGPETMEDKLEMIAIAANGAQVRGNISFSRKLVEEAYNLYFNELFGIEHPKVAIALSMLSYYYCLAAEKDKSADFASLSYAMTLRISQKNPKINLSPVQTHSLALLIAFCPDHTERAHLFARGKLLVQRPEDWFFLATSLARAELADAHSGKDWSPHSVYTVLSEGEYFAELLLSSPHNEHLYSVVQEYQMELLGMRATALLKEGQPGLAAETAKKGARILKETPKMRFNLISTASLAFIIKVLLDCGEYACVQEHLDKLIEVAGTFSGESRPFPESQSKGQKKIDSSVWEWLKTFLAFAIDLDVNKAINMSALSKLEPPPQDQNNKILGVK